MVSAIFLVTVSITATVLVKHLLVVRGHKVVAYLHYSSQDSELVRGCVGREVGRVAQSLCYHHSDLPTTLSVGQAISAAVESSAALVITATPAYTQSAITTAELAIIAGCVQQKQSHYPVVVMVRGLTSSQVQINIHISIHVNFCKLVRTIFALLPTPPQFKLNF